MPTLSASRKEFLLKAANRYRENLSGSPAAALLEERGLLGEEVNPYGLGYVAEPLPGHEMYRGRLAIPYLRKSPSGWSVVTIRFRCARPRCPCEDHPKYLSTTGDDVWIYNTPVLLEETDVVAICEGELDAISANISGVPAVGIPGAENWKPYFASLFVGFDTVFVLSDGDAAGQKFAQTVAKTLPNSKIIPCSDGADVNSEMMSKGREFIRRKVAA